MAYFDPEKLDFSTFLQEKDGQNDSRPYTVFALLDSKWVVQEAFL